MSAFAASIADGGSGPLMDALRECQSGEWAHSSLFVWMADHFETVATAVSDRKVRWAKLAQAAADEGLRTRSGGIAAPNTVKSTWYRVRRAVTALRARDEAARAEEDARREAQKEAAKAEQARKTGEAAATRRKYEDAQRAAQWGREREQARLARSDQPQAATSQSAGPAQAAVVRIGEVAPVFRMLEAAPLYGADARKPLPPPYVGPRPAGMPDNLPLEALVSLDATGRDEQGHIDFKNMPGLPRRSFFENEFQWAQCCLPMIRAIPPLERSMALKEMFSWLRSFPGIK